MPCLCGFSLPDPRRFAMQLFVTLVPCLGRRAGEAVALEEVEGKARLGMRQVELLADHLKRALAGDLAALKRKVAVDIAWRLRFEGCEELGRMLSQQIVTAGGQQLRQAITGDQPTPPGVATQLEEPAAADTGIFQKSRRGWSQLFRACGM